MDWPDFGCRGIGESVITDMRQGAIPNAKSVKCSNDADAVPSHVQTSTPLVRILSYLPKCVPLDAYGAGYLALGIDALDVFAFHDHLERFWIALHHPSGHVLQRLSLRKSKALQPAHNLFDGISGHVAILGSREVFCRPEAGYTYAPELSTDVAFAQPRNVCHSPLEAFGQIELGVVVHLAMEACPWLLGEVLQNRAST